MAEPPKHRLELILMADQASPFHFWVQSGPEWAKVVEYDKDKSRRVAGLVALFLLFAFFSLPAATVLLLLMGSMVLFPLYLVQLVGFFRS